MNLINETLIMEKPAITSHKLHELLRLRWSPRAFADKAVEKNKILRMLEAARWSPSSSNQQPWRFIVGLKGDETYKKIYDVLDDFNQKWTFTAPVLMLAVGDTRSKKNPEIKNDKYKYDVGQAVAHLTFQASADGLFVHQMGGLDNQEAARVFGVPEGCKVLTAIAVGYMGTPDMLEPRLAKSEYKVRERQHLNEMVYSGLFGQNPDFLDQGI
jgi:nitroreductase